MANAARYSVFEAALPTDVAVEWGDPREPARQPFSEEASLVSGALAKRRLEFANGRQCARAALRRLGLPDQPLLSGRQREPVWPPGVIGSISHTDGVCAAAVGWQASYAGLGIDLERARPLAPGVAAQVAAVREMEALAALPPLLAARLVFSAKEAFYKCQFYTTRAWLGFFDVAIELEPTGAFLARLLVDAKPLSLGTCFQGTWRRQEDFLFTAIWMPHAAVRAGEQ
jgi:4'-phosphopantetheinyl transferase EntD